MAKITSKWQQTLFLRFVFCWMWKNFLDFSRFIVNFEQIILIVPMTLTLSWRKTLSYRNQSIYFLCRSMEWFLHDRDLYPESVQDIRTISEICPKLIITLKKSVKFLTCLIENHLLCLNKWSLNTLLYKNITYLRLVSWPGRKYVVICSR